MTAQLERTWVSVCRYDQLVPERGVAALVDGEQVALFRTFDGMLYAIGNRDPFSGAFVLSRGIVGSAGDAPTVASLRPGHSVVTEAMWRHKSPSDALPPVMPNNRRNAGS